MKVFESLGFGKGRFIDVPLPKLSDNSVLVKVYYCGICGTDQDLFSSECSFVENGQVTYPLRPGHEWSGVVEAVGLNVRNFKKGDRVVGDNAIACGNCDACIRGDYKNCEHMLNVGTIDPVYNGAFSEYYLIPEYHLHKIPDGISLKEASLAEPLSVAYGGIKKMNITERSSVAIIGTGCVAMSAVVLAKSLGARKIFVIGRNSNKLKVAQELGAIVLNIKECNAVDDIYQMTDGKGADFVLECSGAHGTFTQALEIVAFRGIVALIGFYDKRENDVNIDLIVSKAITMFGVMGEMGNMSGALKILEDKRPNLLPIITDELDFDDCIKGFTRNNFSNAIKITVRINN